MTGFKVTRFGGVIPRVERRLLPSNSAQLGENVKLFTGELRSWKKTTVTNTPSRGGYIQSIYRIFDANGDYWLSSHDDVDYVKGPIAGDTEFKIYYTGETSTGTNWKAGPRKTNAKLAKTDGTDYPHDWLEMGVPAPGDAPTIIGVGGASSTSVSRVYCYTYVTGTDSQGVSWSEEGPPSPLGTGTGKVDATHWVISSLSTGTTGKYALSGGAVKRIYRALTDNAGNTNFQLALDNVVITTATATDAVADGDLGVICPTFQVGVVGSEWVAPPSDMKGLIALPNGIMAGFSGNLICFSEPFHPHAWPVRYRLATNYEIVSLGHYGQTLVVTTKAFPYAVIGARPDMMSMALIEENRPCVSKRSTVSFPWGVMWATSDGLTLSGVGGTVNVTADYMKRDEWQALCFPDTLIGVQYLDVYFGFFNNGSSGLNFIFDRSNTLGPLIFGNFNAEGAWSDPETATLYLVQNGVIRQWDSDNVNLTRYDWKSKTFVLPKPVNFGAIQVDADYSGLYDTSAISTQSGWDYSVNLAVLGTDTGLKDTSGITAWATGSAYTTGNVVKSLDGKQMAACIVAGTSTNVEPTWPMVLGGTATDGPTLKWKQIWEVMGVTMGDLGGYLLGYYNQINQSDWFQIGITTNGWGFPLGASILQGGVYTTFDDRSLFLQVYAWTTGTDTHLVHAENLVSRKAIRLPLGPKSDTWEVRLSGNIPVRYWKIAETMNELGRIE
jgi:hypothetical protein